VLLIGAEGEQLGVKPLPEALTIARDEGLDLVEVAANANPPVCRIMNYGRYKYEQEQRRKESRRKATNVVVKEMKFRPKIDEHDYTTKMKHVERFLAEGSKVKLTIMFRGREVFHPELGRARDGRVSAASGRAQHDDGAASDEEAQGPGEGTGGRRRSRERERRRERRSVAMPKMKTHRGAAKRFKVTGSGKIRRRKAFRSHLLEKKSSRRTRRLGRGAEVTGGDKKHVERLLGRS